jgi:hypothetical protein
MFRVDDGVALGAFSSDSRVQTLHVCTYNRALLVTTNDADDGSKQQQQTQQWNN